MERPYRDLAQVVLNTTQGIDYRVDIVNRGDTVTIIAAHGGCIEPLTGELAAAIAGEEHNLFVFHGLTQGQRLRVPIVRFKEIRLDSLLDGSKVAVSVDGISGDDPAVLVGGGNQRLAALVCAALVDAGVAAGEAIAPKLVESPARFFNRPREQGVHLELSQALRRTLTSVLLEDMRCEDAEGYTRVFDQMVAAIRSALQQYRAEITDDLDLTLERFERETKAIPPALRSSYHEHSHH